MKRFTLLLLIVLLILPGTSAFAQDPPPPPPVPPSAFGQCDLFFWLDDFSGRLDTLQSLEDFGSLLTYAGQSLVDCGEEWLNMIPALLMGAPAVDFTQPAPVDPVIVDDDLMNPEEAEAVIRAAFLGDIASANQYICEANQLDEEDAEFTPEGIVIEALKCARANDRMICEGEISFEGVSAPLTLQFDIVDEQLCGGDLLQDE
jgi:hypothetical protein